MAKTAEEEEEEEEEEDEPEDPWAAQLSGPRTSKLGLVSKCKQRKPDERKIKAQEGKEEEQATRIMWPQSQWQQHERWQ